MLIPNNLYYLICLKLYLYLSSDGLFSCSTLTPEYWHLKLALQLYGIKVNLSPHKYALRTHFYCILPLVQSGDKEKKKRDMFIYTVHDDKYETLLLLVKGKFHVPVAERRGSQ